MNKNFKKVLIAALAMSAIFGSGALTSHAEAIEVEPIAEPKDTAKEEVGNDIAKVEEVKEEVQPEIKEENIDNNVYSESNAESKENGKDKNLKNAAENNNSSLDNLEVSSDAEKEAVKANENKESETILPEAKFNEDMSIDDPAAYDYAGYLVKHYNPTNEKFLKERNDPMYMIDDILKDNTDKKNEKIICQNVTIEKGKDLSSKVDEYIIELEKNKGNKNIDVDDIKIKVFGENLGFNKDVSYFDSYLNCLHSIYNSTYQGDGDGHKLFVDGKLFASDLSVENFKEIQKKRIC